MSQVEYEKPSFQELVDEIAIIIEGKDSGAVLTALTVLVGNAGYFHEMEFEQFMDCWRALKTDPFRGGIRIQN